MKLKNTLALSLADVMAAGLTACGSGASSTPALSIAFAPVKPSSSGWKTSFTVPLSSL